MKGERKSKSFLLRMGETEMEMLLELADETGLAQAAIIRELIRREYAKVFAPRLRARPNRGRRSP